MTVADKNILFSEEQIRAVQARPVPQHVAIIMDGNRRWTMKNKLAQLKNVLEGHWAGADTLVTAVEAAKEIGIKILTVYGLSTENRQRSAKEVETIFNIAEVYLNQNCSKMIEKGVRFEVIGNISELPASLQQAIAAVKEKTKECTAITVIVALNYGSRDEIKRAMQKIAKQVISNQLKVEEISEEIIARNLDTKGIADPDLLIRTSSEMRISNFLLWQLAYTEMYIEEVLWPDFSPQHLLKAILDFQNRDRRIGR